MNYQRLAIWALAIYCSTWNHTSLVAQVDVAKQVDLADFGDSLVKNRADILLITSEELAASWRAFAIWKTKTGRPTRIVTVAEIDQQFAGVDIQAKIRACCLTHVEQLETKWVILGGDSRGKKSGPVPDRNTDHSDSYGHKRIPTDVYYLSQSDWDANQDGVYGRFGDDLAACDYTNPRASLGRIPLRTAADVQAYTQKVIEYESSYPQGDFAAQMVYTCPIEAAYPKLSTSQKSIEKIWETGKLLSFYGTMSPWDKDEPGDYDLTAKHWTKLINDKRSSKLHMHGHGLRDLWVLEDDQTVTADTVSELTNRGAYPIITTVSCFTGHYDSFKDPSIAEQMLRTPNAGAIAMVAPSREGTPVFHKDSDFIRMVRDGKMDGTTEFMTRFWGQVLKGNQTIGESFRQAKIEMTSDGKQSAGYHYIQCELNLLGDPTLDGRAQLLANLQPTVLVSSTANGSKIVVDNVRSCTVCLWDEASFYQTISVDTDGTTTLDVPSTKQNYRLSVSGPNRNTWTDTIAIDALK